MAGFRPLQAQSFEAGVSYLQGIRYTNAWDLYRGGTEVSLDFRLPKGAWLLHAGLDFRTVQWGSQLALSLGTSREVARRVEVGAELQNGLALFRESPLYTLGITARVHYMFWDRAKFKAGVSSGVRYTVCPGYRKYSPIYSVWELPFGIFVRF